jgi:hypothetical protein
VFPIRCRYAKYKAFGGLYDKEQFRNTKKGKNALFPKGTPAQDADVKAEEKALVDSQIPEITKKANQAVEEGSIPLPLEEASLPKEELQALIENKKAKLKA